ncbi:MAG: hypothetical protein JWM35_1690, partial [Verrucomicrobia bacterium]|nr:hypothetical protein [Verrucomicrobiota bacterium]
LLSANDRVLELGAGTGELGQRLAGNGLAIDGLDLWPRPADWLATQGWHRANLLDFPGYAPYTAVIGNLIFHQFTEEELSALGKKLRTHARVILACEPLRRRFSQALFSVFGRALGANRVSLHDARVSIAAGFRADELPRALGLAPSEWECRCFTTALGAYRLIAVRRSA